MQIEVTTKQYAQLLAMVELGEYALHMPLGMGLMLPPNLRDIMEDLSKHIDRSEITPDVVEQLQDDTREAIQGFAMEPEVRPVLVPSDMEHYLTLFRQATMLLGGVSTVNEAEDIDHKDFNEAILQNSHDLGQLLRKQIALLPVNESPPSDGEANEIATVLARRFEQGEAIDRLLKDVGKDIPDA